jgi:hypothetical protein
MPRVDLDTEVVVAAAEVLDECVPELPSLATWAVTRIATRHLRATG